MLRHACALATIAFASFMLATGDAAASAQRTFVASYGVSANTLFNLLNRQALPSV